MTFSLLCWCCASVFCNAFCAVQIAVEWLRQGVLKGTRSSVNSCESDCVLQVILGRLHWNSYIMDAICMLAFAQNIAFSGKRKLYFVEKSWLACATVLGVVALLPLRQGTSDEIKKAVQVMVELAHGATQLYQNPMNGTLPSETPLEPTLTLRGLVELGYTITWSRAGCVVKHTRLAKIECCEVWMSSGPKRSRSDSHDGDQAHGHGKEDTPTLHAGRSEIPRKEIDESAPKSLDLKGACWWISRGEPGVCSKV